MNDFLKITPENHENVIRQIPGKLYILYFSADCVFCREAVLELITMPENSLFTYAVCRVDEEKDFRMKENLLSLPTVRVYEDGVKIRETNGYNSTYGVSYDMRGSIEKCENYHTVYADNAATTKLSKKALKAFVDAAKENYGNPSTNYELGAKAKGALNYARSVIRETLHLKKGSVIFTGGGSEADNQALYSAYREGLKQNKKHMITSAIEHHAVLHTLESFRESGFEITVLGVDAKGRIDLKELETAIRPDTILVSIMYANNEIGTIQPVKEIGAICKEHGVLFHCDAVQAVGHVPIDLSKMNIDYLSLAAHKFNGPKGVGALVVSDDVPVSSLILGGGQEFSHRAGTENVQGIYAMAAALKEHAKHMKRDMKNTRELMDRLLAGLQEIPDIVFNGDPENRLPGTVNVSFKNVRGRELLFLLDAKYGICVSGGSACNTNSKSPSHVLLALGLPEELADSAVRVSLNQDNTPEDVDYIVNALKESTAYLRG
ncbi:MAG: IscS subfamily cysteine desulfurase [Eubacteriales bacterium]|nr:IscS subfamily cysteine desulfurase [Eubacteriales bacterium]